MTMLLVWSVLGIGIVGLVSGSTTSVEGVIGTNTCLVVVQVPINVKETVYSRQSARVRCRVGSLVDLVNGRCLQRYLLRYARISKTTTITRMKTVMERRCCNGTTEVSGVCVAESNTGADTGSAISALSDGTLTSIVVLLVVFGCIGTIVTICVCRRKNMYKARPESTQAITNDLYAIDRDKGSSHHIYVLPDDPSYQKLDEKTRELNQNVYDQILVYKELSK